MALNRPPEPHDQLSTAAEHGRGAPGLTAERVVRQLQAIDAWNARRARHEQVLREEVASREDRLELARRVDVLRRTQAAIQERAARELATERAPMVDAGRPTAVIAHRHSWFSEKAARALGDRGVEVVACTDNAADALGAVVAEQPDLVLAGSHLAMMTGAELLTQTRQFAAAALCAAQLADDGRTTLPPGCADAVFLANQPPVDVADALLRLLDRRPPG